MCKIMGYSRTEFYDMSLADIVNLIEKHKENNQSQYDSYSKKNKSQTTKGETETFGVSEETLRRWAEEDKAKGLE